MEEGGEIEGGDIEDEADRGVLGHVGNGLRTGESR